MLSECRKCGSAREIKLQITGDEMIPVCMECGEPQLHFSKVMINMMKMNKDIKQGVSADEHVPFGFPCSQCKRTQEMIYDKKEKGAKCSVCGSPAKVSPYMLRSMELTGHIRPSTQASDSYDGGPAGDEPTTTGKGKVKRKAK